MTLHMRSMQSDDVDGVFAIELVAHRAPWSRSIFSDCLLVGYDCRVLEIEQENKHQLIGYIISRYHGTTCHVLNLCVAPSHQGKRYGEVILHNLIDSIDKLLTETIVLEVRPSNLPALRLYQRIGFQQVGIKKSYYSDEFGIEDAVVLQKNLVEKL